VPASAPAATATTAGTPVAPRPAPTPFTPFLGAAYPPHAGRNDEREHNIPSFLISLDNSHELIGPLPKVAPPVIGE
jgi:hypothetical protein